MNVLAVMQELKQGGDWLGAARSWMQSNVQRGDTLPWGSSETVHIPFCKLEEMALRVAVAAVAADRTKRSALPNQTAKRRPWASA